MKPAPGRRIMTTIYVVIASVMYYFNNEFITLGVGIMYKLFLSFILILLSFSVFLITANLERAQVLGKYVLLLSLPQVLAVMISVPLWMMNGVQPILMRRGFMEELYNVGIVVNMAGFVYVFGPGAIWRVLAAMFTANFFRIVGIIAENGIVPYLEELRTLVLGFASETGELIQRAEIHELTFALGVYVVFFILNFKRIRGKRWAVFLAFGLTLFFYLSGFKRIGVVANGAAVLSALFLRIVMGKKEDGRRGWLLAASFVAIIACYVYVFLVRGGLVDFLAEHGINLMSRDRFYAMVEEYYRVRPDYLGRGVGFISRLFTESSASALHNDILRIYIDLGFWGFFVWLAACLPIRVWFVAKWQGNRGGILCFAYTAYLLTTASTDNTFYYVYVIGAMALLIMSFKLEDEEKALITAQREALYDEE